MSYAETIRSIAPSYDARHVEAYMRVEHDTLDWISASRFAAEVRIACACVDAGGTEMAERIARSFGL